MVGTKGKARKATRKPSGTPRRRRGVKLRPTELSATELALTEPPAELVALAGGRRADGGAVLARYREPLGGHALLLVALPIDKVAPTPFQRDVSDAHVRKLTHAMDKTKRFLDPIIAVREADRPRRQRRQLLDAERQPPADRAQGARREEPSLALLVPEREVAYQILALNIEKAHNLREKALEVRAHVPRSAARRAANAERRRTRSSSRSRRW